jgi:hypothetical protein
MTGDPLGTPRPVREKPPKRPGTLVAGVVILVVMAVLTVVYGSSIIGTAQRHSDGYDVTTGWLIIAPAIAQLVLAIAVWIGWSWARWVIGVFTVGAFFAGLLTGTAPVGLANVLAVVLLFLPSSNLWYSDLRAMRCQRAGR